MRKLVAGTLLCAALTWSAGTAQAATLHVVVPCGCNPHNGPVGGDTGHSANGMNHAADNPSGVASFELELPPPEP